MPKEGYIDTIQDSGSNTFSGNIKEGNQDVPFVNQAFVDNDGAPITSIDNLGFDSIIEFNEVDGKATDCKACIQVRIIGNLDRPNTSAQIKNLANAIKKEPGTNIGVMITKG